MYCLSLDSTDPFFNLAVDEYLLKNSLEDFLILGINDRSVIIGKHQIAQREADTRFVTENGIPVIRRISGGGTVFHDSGNLNFSFLLKSEFGSQVDFRKYTLPVINFLSSIGVEAKFEGKNDIKVDGFKISGNAEHVFHDRVLHHGTLLYNADMEALKNSIRKDTGKYNTRAVSSNPSSVINLKEVLKVVLKDRFSEIEDIHGFRSAMLKWFTENYPRSEIYTLSAEESTNIERLAEKKYRSWEWNYAYGPEYNFNSTFKFEGKECSCWFLVKDGVISDCEIKGSEKLLKIYDKLIGCRHMVEDLLEVFSKEAIFAPGFDIYNLF
jgi:lipoate-protein ligase A